MTRITGTLREDECAFMIAARRILRMRNVSGKSCRANQNKHLFSVIFFSEILAVCEIMWRNVIEPDRPHMAILYKAAHKMCDLHAR